MGKTRPDGAAHAFFSAVLAQKDDGSAKYTIPLRFRDEKQYYATLRAFLILEARAIAARALKEKSRAPRIPQYPLHGYVVNDDPLTVHIDSTCVLNRGTLVRVETAGALAPSHSLFFVDGTSSGKVKLFGSVPAWRFDKEHFLTSLGPIHRREQVPAADVASQRLAALRSHFGSVSVVALEDLSVLLRTHAIAWAKPHFDSAWRSTVCGDALQRGLHITFDSDSEEPPARCDSSAAVLTTHRAEIRDGISTHHSQGLNTAQRQALDRAVQPGIHLLQGPPGSGKTKTATAIVNAYPPEALVVLTAASNQATQHLLTSVCRNGHALDRVVLVGVEEKVGENDVCRAAYVHTRLQHLQTSWANGSRTELRRLERDVGQPTWQLLKLRGDDETVKKRIDELAQSEASGECGYIEVALIRNARIVVATLASLGRSIIAAGLNRRFVDVLVLDEAAQALEAETLPCFALKPKSWVLLGDPQQLTATVIHSAEAKAGCYGRSLMERLMEVHGNRVLLDTQYRMHRAISSFVSRRYYSGELKNAQGLPGYTVPYAVIVHDGAEVFHGPRVTNPSEARLIAELIRCVRWQAEPTILTFYQGQKQLLQKMTACHVSTVDAFQGQEALSVIISWVRSSAGGFLENFRRLNVALSRAKQRLLVVMHANQSAEGLALLEDARQRGLIYTKEQYIAEASVKSKSTVSGGDTRKRPRDDSCATTASSDAENVFAAAGRDTHTASTPSTPSTASSPSTASDSANAPSVAARNMAQRRRSVPFFPLNIRRRMRVLASLVRKKKKRK